MAAEKITTYQDSEPRKKKEFNHKNMDISIPQSRSLDHWGQFQDPPTWIRTTTNIRKQYSTSDDRVELGCEFDPLTLY